MVRKQVDLLKEVFTKHDKVVVVVLDAVNIDVFRKVYGEDFEVVWSEGFSTEPWLIKTFIENSENKIFREVTYICSNPFCELHFNKLRKIFHTIIPLSQKYWNSKYGTVMPAVVTTSTLIYAKFYKYRKMIVHYMQPHPPFIHLSYNEPSIRKEDVVEKKINREYLLARCSWRYRKFFKLAYVKNLEIVLTHVRKLTNELKQMNYEVYLTADHGEILGKWRPNPLKPKWLFGLCRFVGHTRDFEELHLVPWVRLD